LPPQINTFILFSFDFDFDQKDLSIPRLATAFVFRFIEESWSNESSAWTKQGVLQRPLRRAERST
jgi:hypothetical protein